MKVGEIIASVVETIVKLALFLFICSLIYKGALMAYDYGYRVFTESPVSVGEGRTISVEIKDDQSAMDIGKMLKQKGLIRDERIFYLQELLSEYHDKEVPGIYDLSTAMTAEEMLAVISPDSESTDEEDESDDISIITEEDSSENATMDTPYEGEDLTGDEAVTEDGSESGDGSAVEDGAAAEDGEVQE